MFKFIKSLFKPKFLVPVSQHSDYIIDRMIARRITWFGKNGLQMRQTFWTFLEQDFGVKQKYSWRDKCNYMVFEDEQHYQWFLLTL